MIIVFNECVFRNATQPLAPTLGWHVDIRGVTNAITNLGNPKRLVGTS
jgi:hypothetical protein